MLFAQLLPHPRRQRVQLFEFLMVLVSIIIGLGIATLGALMGLGILEAD